MSTYPDYAAEMQLPPGKMCADCANVHRCVVVLGCTTPERTTCDFYPNKFEERTVNEKETGTYFTPQSIVDVASGSGAFLGEISRPEAASNRSSRL